MRTNQELTANDVAQTTGHSPQKVKSEAWKQAAIKAAGGTTCKSLYQQALQEMHDEGMSANDSAEWDVGTGVLTERDSIEANQDTEESDFDVGTGVLD